MSDKPNRPPDFRDTIRRWPLPPRYYAQEVWLRWLIQLGVTGSVAEIQRRADRGQLIESAAVFGYRWSSQRGGDAIA